MQLNLVLTFFLMDTKCNKIKFTHVNKKVEATKIHEASLRLAVISENKFQFLAKGK